MSFKTFGFTLLETVIVLAMGAILISLSYSSYQHYLMKAARMNAQVMLWQTASYLENYYSEHGTYQGVSLNSPTITEDGRYRLVLSHISKSAYILSAIPQKAQLQDKKCAALYLNEKNEQWHDGLELKSSCWIQ